jgi:hypothetical protein
MKRFFMPGNEIHSIPLWPMVLYAIVVGVLLVVILTLSYNWDSVTKTGPPKL